MKSNFKKKHNPTANSLVQQYYYMTYDVITHPVTEIYIRLSYQDHSHLNFREQTNFQFATSIPNSSLNPVIRQDDLEDSYGWKNVLFSGKTGLSICLKHSFGKCLGSKNNDPSTCSQIHVRRDVLDIIRKNQIFSEREYFLHTVKALIKPELKKFLTKEQLKFKFLEFKIEDVHFTEGLKLYDNAFRNWLKADHSSKNEADQNFSYNVYFCSNYPMCNNGKQCQHIHASIENASSRDKLMLSEISKIHSQFHASIENASSRDNLILSNITKIQSQQTQQNQQNQQTQQTQQQPILNENTIVEIIKKIDSSLYPPSYKHAILRLMREWGSLIYYQKSFRTNTYLEDEKIKDILKNFTSSFNYKGDSKDENLKENIINFINYLRNKEEKNEKLNSPKII